MATPNGITLLASTSQQVMRTGTLANIRLSSYAGWAVLTVVHGPSQPESTIAVPLADAQSYVLGQSITVGVA